MMIYDDGLFRIIHDYYICYILVSLENLDHPKWDASPPISTSADLPGATWHWHLELGEEQLCSAEAPCMSPGLVTG